MMTSPLFRTPGAAFSRVQPCSNGYRSHYRVSRKIRPISAVKDSPLFRRYIGETRHRSGLPFACSVAPPRTSCTNSRPSGSRFAGASLLALVLTWKYGFHLPLYRQSQIFAHAGLTLSRTTLMQWVGATSELLAPLVAALAKYVLSAYALNADDTKTSTR